MAGKDEFKFDEDGGFPETDLSEAFSEGEQTVPNEPEFPMTIKPSGGSKTRLLMLLLLLVVAAGGGYYSLTMNEPEPTPPPPRKVVAVPKPPPAPAATAQPATAAGNSSQVNVPAPPPVQSAASAASPDPAAANPGQTAVSLAPPPKPAAPAASPASVPPPALAPTPGKPTAAVALPTATSEAKGASASGVKPSPAKGVPAITGGPWLVEAGTYLHLPALKSAEKKIRALGYEPQVTTTQKSVRMTRLRLGSFRAGEVKEALAYARGVAPDAFALRAGETFTVYAGTFTSAQNIRQMSERLTSEGLSVEEEPVEVKRTISLVRFGGFDDQATAAEVAARARKVGIAAGVFNPR